MEYFEDYNDDYEKKFEKYDDMERPRMGLQSASDIQSKIDELERKIKSSEEFSKNTRYFFNSEGEIEAYGSEENKEIERMKRELDELKRELDEIQNGDLVEPSRDLGDVNLYEDEGDIDLYKDDEDEDLGDIDLFE